MRLKRDQEAGFQAKVKSYSSYAYLGKQCPRFATTSQRGGSGEAKPYSHTLGNSSVLKFATKSLTSILLAGLSNQTPCYAA